MLCTTRSDAGGNDLAVALETVAFELKAARVLLANLRCGGGAAAVHLRRADALMRDAWWKLESRGDDPGTGDSSPAPQAQHDALPGLNAGERQAWSSSTPLVWQAAEAPEPQVQGDARSDAAELTHRALLVHGLIEVSLLSLVRRRRQLAVPTRWRARGRWVVGALTLTGVAAIVALAVSTRGFLNEHPRRPQVPPTPAAKVRSRVGAAELAVPKAPHTPWDARGNVIIPPDPRFLIIDLETTSHARAAELSLDNNDRYRIDFLHAGTPVSSATVGPVLAAGGLVVYCVEIEAGAATGGFDAVRVTPLDGDTSWSIGHLTLFDADSCERPRSKLAR